MGYHVARIRLALIALVAAMTVGISGVSAYGPDDGPVLLLDRIVVQQGAPVTVTLNRFLPGQQATLHLRLPITGTPGTVLNAFPTTMDANGSGIALIPTTGLSPGNYLISVAVDGASDDLGAPFTAFAVIDGGFLGPRVVRSMPLPDDDG